MRTKVYITTCTLALCFLTAFPARASEVIGTISTGVTAATSSEITGTVVNQEGGLVLYGGWTPTPTNIEATVVGGTPEFGPRFGFEGSGSSGSIPGAPDAGGNTPYPDVSVESDLSVIPDIVSFASFPTYGTTPLETRTDLTAAAISGTSGLTFAQLAYLAFVALLILAAIGYGISRSEQQGARLRRL